MPPIPSDQRYPSPRGDGSHPDARDDHVGNPDRHSQVSPDPVHLTIKELADRWRRTPKTIERHYQEWGLIPLRFGGRLIFPIEHVLEAERRAMVGETTSRRTNEQETPPAAADIAKLKAAMAAAHPDRGGSEAAFIKARNRYVEARRAQLHAAKKRARCSAKSRRGNEP